MTPIAEVVGILIGMSVVVAVLYVCFGQITVRKLRRNPETKNTLGLELASGWDILNVAGALSRPRWLNKKFKASTLSALAADSDILFKNTNSFDRALARIFWICYVVTGSSMVIFGVPNLAGIFD